MSQARSFKEIPQVSLPADYESNLGPFLTAMYERHGSIFRTDLYGQPLVFMVGPEANRFVLSGPERLKLSHHQGWHDASDLFGNGLLTMDGPEHDQHRRMMNPAFTFTYMDRYLPMMQSIIETRIDDWGRLGEVDVYDEARKITFDVAAQTLTGLQIGPEVDYFREIYVQILNLGSVATSMEDYSNRLAGLNQELYTLLKPKIDQRRQQPTDDVLGRLIQARDEEGRALSDGQLIAHTNILLVAGHETSTSLASWLLYLLAQNPAYTARVLEEQARLLPDAQAVPTLEDLKQMKVLDNALSEAERLYPPVGNGPRGVLEEFEFDGYRVPAGCLVYYAIAASHLLPQVWADPTRFDPDRFAPPREEHKKTPYALVGFGGGPRICIGINFAQVEIKLLASLVLRRFNLEVVPDQQIVQVYWATSRLLNGLKLKFSSRQVGALAQ